MHNLHIEIHVSGFFTCENSNYLVYQTLYIFLFSVLIHLHDRLIFLLIAIYTLYFIDIYFIYIDVVDDLIRNTIYLFAYNISVNSICPPFLVNTDSTMHTSSWARQGAFQHAHSYIINVEV